MRISNPDRVRPRESTVETQPKLQPALLSLFAAQTLATTVKRFGAVSSVVERLVYTERVGGSNPSPPRFPLPIAARD